VFIGDRAGRGAPPPIAGRSAVDEQRAARDDALAGLYPVEYLDQAIGGAAGPDPAHRQRAVGTEDPDARLRALIDDAARRHRRRT
jgi:hypothetical protein